MQTGHRLRGIGTYTRSLLRALLAIDQSTSYGLIAHGDPGQPAGPLRESVAGALGLGQLPGNVAVLKLARPALGRFSGFASHQIALPALLAGQQDADLFHSPGFVAAFSVPGLPWRCPLPLAVTLHDFLPYHEPGLFSGKAVNRWWYGRQTVVARRASQLICVSQSTALDAQHYLGVEATRCSVVLEGVDHSAFHPLAPGDPVADSPFILFVGGDYANKNRRGALAAFARLTASTALPHKLVLVGQDATTDSDLERRYPGLDVSRVTRLQAVSPAELAELYRLAALFLFPSTWEGFGLPVLEAMASGIPVVASNTSSLPEVAGDAALLVNPERVEEIFAALARVLGDPVLSQQMRDKGIVHAASFTWEEAARQTLAVYQAVADRATAELPGAFG